MTPLLKIFAVSLTFLMFSCQNGPKRISLEESAQSSARTGIFDQEPAESPSLDFNDELHIVKVLEKIDGTRYVYLNVEEGENSFWVATDTRDVIPGLTYFYRRGLLKTQFESTELNRVFDRIYFVGNLVRADHGSSQTRIAEVNAVPTDGNDLQGAQTDAPANTQKIADIVSDPEKFGGQTIRVSGTCVKINANIMGRNWVHIQDGSRDDYDFVVTTNDRVREGQEVTFSGVLGLDRDFGAGYRYDLILEGARLSQ